MKTAIAYSRCSTAKQEKSIPEQRASIEQWAGRNGFTILRHFADEGISGSEFDRRPGFQAMLSFITSDSAASLEAVLVYDKARFGRPGASLKEATEHERTIEDAGKNIIYTSTGRVADGSLTSAIMDTVENAAAADFLHKLSHTISRHQCENAAAGFSTGMKPPYGYDLLVIRGDGTARHRVRYLATGVKNRYRRLLLDPSTGATREEIPATSALPRYDRTDRSRLIPGAADEIAVVREAFAARVRGLGFRAIACDFNARKIPAPCGRIWAVSAVRSLLTNDAYQGDLVAFKRTSAKFNRPSREGVAPRDRRKRGAVEVNARADRVTSRDAHEALVPRDVWAAAQQPHRKLNANAGKGVRSEYLLSNVVRCARCGCVYTGQKTRKAGTDLVTKRYLCSGYWKGGKAVCRMGSVMTAAVEVPLMKVLREHFDSKEGEEALVAAIRGEIASDGGTGALEVARARRAEIDQRMGTLVEELSSLPAAARPATRAKIATLSADLEAADQEIAILEVQSTGKRDPDQLVKDALERLRQLRRLVRSSDPKALKSFIREVVRKIELDVESGRAYVEFNEAAGPMVCGRGESDSHANGTGRLEFEVERWSRSKSCV